MTAILYQNRKSDPVLWDCSTPEKLVSATLALFRHLKNEWEVYAELEEPIAWDAKPTRQHKLYAKAKSGDATAALQLLQTRKSYEYEYWCFVEIGDPDEEAS